jgi:predicted ABC-type ATPase
MAHLGDAIRLVHGTMIYDNSSIAGPTLLIQIDNNIIAVNTLDKAKPLHARSEAYIP